MITPIDLFRHDFVQNAFLAGTLVAILSGLVGYFVVLRGQAFVCEAMSHVGFAGAAGAALIGVSPLIGMLLFTLLGAAGMGALGRRLRNRDVEVGMLLAFLLGVGLLFLSFYIRNASAAVNLLFGSILSVTNADVILTGLSCLLSLIILAILFRPLLFMSVDPDVAEARGVPIAFLSTAFLILLAFCVAQAMQVVGVLLVFALLIVPAAAAEKLTHSPLAAIGWSVLISLVSTWGGLILAFIGHWPASFYIVSMSCGIYFLSFIPSRLHPSRSPTGVNHRGRERHLRA